MNIDKLLALRLCQCGVACEQFIYPRAFVIVSDLPRENESRELCFRLMIYDLFVSFE